MTFSLRGLLDYNAIYLTYQTCIFLNTSILLQTCLHFQIVSINKDFFLDLNNKKPDKTQREESCSSPQHRHIESKTTT